MILHHTGWISGERGDHWDWMLEPAGTDNDGLLTFAATADPRTGWLDAIVESLPRHRSEYLRYQGPVSGGRGHVKRVATGLIRWAEPPSIDLCFDLVRMEFLEAPFAPWPTGRYCLTRCDESHSSKWRLVRTEEAE